MVILSFATSIREWSVYSASQLTMSLVVTWWTFIEAEEVLMVAMVKRPDVTTWPTLCSRCCNNGNSRRHLVTRRRRRRRHLQPPRRRRQGNGRELVRFVGKRAIQCRSTQGSLPSTTDHWRNWCLIKFQIRIHLINIRFCCLNWKMKQVQWRCSRLRPFTAGTTAIVYRQVLLEWHNDN